MTERLSAPRTPREIRESIGREAARAGVVAYLVGGAVRDQLRRRRVRDLDVAVEGDAVAFARDWARVSGGRLVSTSEFGTAAVDFGPKAGGRRVDFASTRSETYVSPAALPAVRPAGIREDLARRDFTINAMAIPLNGPLKGELLDPHGGSRDLARGLVRMLHERSPHDDPTRAFRAIRFELRLGFRIGSKTRRWIADAIASGAFARLSGDRLRREILLLFGEQPASRGISALATLRLEKTIWPSLETGKTVRRRLDRLETLQRRHRADAALADPNPTGWASLLCWSLELPGSERDGVGRRLGLSGSALREFVKLGDRARQARASGRAPRMSELAALSRDWPTGTLLAVASDLEPSEASRLLRARSMAGRVRLTISGEDLRRSGVAPGPAIGRALESTWRARIDRRIDASQELPYALALAEVKK